MVSSSKSLKTSDNNRGYQNPRRNMLGVSDAVREKALRSTSPSCEKTTSVLKTPTKSSSKILSVEERLKQLLKVDQFQENQNDQERMYERRKSENFVEGIEHTNNKYSTPSRLRSKTPNPVTSNKNYGTLYRNVDYQQHIVNYHQHNQRMNRLQNQYNNMHKNEPYNQTYEKLSNQQKNMYNTNTQDTYYIEKRQSTPETNNTKQTSHHNTKYNQSNVEMRTKHMSASQRRCKSAVPANFQDQDLNVVNSSVQKANNKVFQDATIGSSKNSKSTHNLSRNPPSHDTTMTSYQIVVKPSPGGGKPVPAVRRSLHSTPAPSPQKHPVPTQQDKTPQHNLSPSSFATEENLKRSKTPSDHHTKNTPKKISQSHLHMRRCLTPQHTPNKSNYVDLQKNICNNKYSEKLVDSPNKKSVGNQRKLTVSKQNASFRRAVRGDQSSSSSDANDDVIATPLSAVNVKRAASSGQTSLDSGAVMTHDTKNLTSSSIRTSMYGEAEQSAGLDVNRSATPLLPQLNYDVTRDVSTKISDEKKLSLTSVAGYKIVKDNGIKNDARYVNHKQDYLRINFEKDKRNDNYEDPKLLHQNRTCLDNNFNDRKYDPINKYKDVSKSNGTMRKLDHDVYDSESVFSVTTASVCSSAIRSKGGRRYRSKRGKSDRYFKEMRSMNKRFSRLEANVMSLARSLSQLSNDMHHQAVNVHQIELIKKDIAELRARQENLERQQAIKSTNKKVTKESARTKMNKLTKFFHEPSPQPSLINIFLKRLGYEKYIKNFQHQSIGMSELPYLEEKQLEEIGIPLGPRKRILMEAKKSSFV